MIEINLIPDVKRQLIQAVRVRTTVISFAIVASLVAVAVIVLLAIYTFGVQTVQVGIASQQITDKNKELKSVKDLSKILTIQNQLTKVNQLNDGKQVDSRIFQILESIIPPSPDNVQISSLVIDAEEGTLNIEGQAPSGYKALETFKKTVGFAQLRYIDEDKKTQTEPLASEIDTGDVSYGDADNGSRVLRFNLTFKYNEMLFSPTITNISIVLNNQGNITDSYLGVPKSIFTDRANDIQGAQ